MAWGKGRVPVGINTSDSDFKTVEKTGGEKTQNLRALIGATHSTISRIGYAAAAKIDGYNYTYSINGNDAIANVPIEHINHSTLVKRHDGADPHTLQPYIVCYMWKRTA